MGLHYISASAELSPDDPEWERIRSCFTNGRPYIDGDMEWLITRIAPASAFAGPPLIVIDLMATKQRSMAR